METTVSLEMCIRDRHIEVLVRVQLAIEEGDGASLRKGFQCGGKVAFRDAARLGTAAEKHQHGV